MKIIAIDMGGTQTRLALYDMNGNQLDKFVFSTIVEDPDKQIEIICQYINEKKKENDISVIGMCSPGPLDIDNGVMLDLPNLPKFKNFGLTDAITKLTGINCHLLGDAQSAAAGEASQYDDGSTNVFFTISTGFGAGLVINGENYMGTNKIAMEIFDSKFTYINYNGDVSIRTIEQIVSGTHLYNEAIANNLNVENTKGLFDLYNEGNEVAIYIIDNMITNLALFVVNTSYILDPTRYIIGGSVFNHNKFLFDKLKVEVNKYIRPELQDKYDIIPAHFVDDAGLVGAYMYGKKFI